MGRFPEATHCNDAMFIGLVGRALMLMLVEVKESVSRFNKKCER